MGRLLMRRYLDLPINLADAMRVALAEATSDLRAAVRARFPVASWLLHPAVCSRLWRVTAGGTRKGCTQSLRQVSSLLGAKPGGARHSQSDSLQNRRERGLSHGPPDPKPGVPPVGRSSS